MLSATRRLRQFPAGIHDPVEGRLQLHTMISLGVAVGTTSFAVKHGDWAARRFALAFFSAWVASLAVCQIRAQGTSPVVFCIDSATLAYFAWTSLRSRQLWTAVATAFMLLIVASHVATAIDFRIEINTFRVSMALWSYGILACIGFGAWSSRRERDGAPAPTARQGVHPRCSSTVGISR